MIEESDFVEAPAERWSWSVLPLATFACANQVLGSFSEFFGNLAFALGMHMKYRREQEDSATPTGPIIGRD